MQIHTVLYKLNEVTNTDSTGSVAVPTNGLVVYCGTVMTEEGKEKKVNIDFEPFRPINTSLYLCDNKFHTEVHIVTGWELRYLRK